MKGWRVASKRLGPLPRIKWAALGRDCGREGSGALQLPRAAAVSTRLRVRVEVAVAGGGASARKQARVGGERRVGERVGVQQTYPEPARPVDDVLVVGHAAAREGHLALAQRTAW